MLPLPDVENALRELEHALDALHLDGVVLLSSQSDGRYLGDPLFDDVMAELDRRAAVVFVHPTVPKTSEALRLEVPGYVAEFTFDTTRAAIHLIWTGAVERNRHVRFIERANALSLLPRLAARLGAAS